MESFNLMMEAGNYLPKHIVPWTYWMQFILFAVPILFLKHKAAQYLILSQILNTITAYLVFVAEGNDVTRLFGLGHLFWIVPLWFLIADFRSDKWRVYRWFCIAAATTITISLVFDIWHITSWILGDRASMLVDVPKSSALYR